MYLPLAQKMIEKQMKTGTVESDTGTIAVKDECSMDLFYRGEIICVCARYAGEVRRRFVHVAWSFGYVLLCVFGLLGLRLSLSVCVSGGSYKNDRERELLDLSLVKKLRWWPELNRLSKAQLNKKCCIRIL